MANVNRRTFRYHLFEKTFKEVSKRYPNKSRRERRELTRTLVETMWADYNKLQKTT